MESKFLRPSQAAGRFGVSRQTLIRWANARLIGRAQVGGLTFLVASDIEDLIARNVAARTVVPITAPAQQPDPSNDWRGYFGLAPRVPAARQKRKAGKR